MTMKPSLTPPTPPPPTPSKCLVKRGMTIEQNEYDECFLLHRFRILHATFHSLRKFIDETTFGVLSNDI